MQFSSIVSLLSAAAVAVAQSTVVGFDSGIPSRVTVGVPVNLPYYSTGPVDIRLRRGPQDNLDQGTVLISGTSGGSYRWVPTGLADGDDYALEISQDDEVNYFGPITVTGGSSSSSSSSSSASSTNSASRVVGPSYTPAQTPVTPVYTPRVNSTTPTSSNSAAPSGSSNPAPYPVPVPNRNSTTTSSSASQPSETADSGAAATSAPPGGNGASQLGSSLALIVGIVAAFAYLN